MTDSEELRELQESICILRDKIAGLQRIAERETDNAVCRHQESISTFHNGRAEACKDVIELMDGMVKPFDLPEKGSD